MTVKILLVDDNLTFLAAVKACLDKLPGVAVVGEATDGRDALVKAHALKPDLVLLDIVMPYITGLDVAGIIQTWPQPPRIVFLSMHDGLAYRAAARNLGVLGYVGKADFVAELLPIVERIVVAESGELESRS